MLAVEFLISNNRAYVHAPLSMRSVYQTYHFARLQTPKGCNVWLPVKCLGAANDVDWRPALSDARNFFPTGDTDLQEAGQRDCGLWFTVIG